MLELASLHRNPVTDQEIDELGHFSAPFYDLRAYQANAKLVETLGFDPVANGVSLIVVDAYRRNLAEQFLGADVEIKGGVLEVNEGGLRVYHEMRNVETNELSATFVHELQLVSDSSRLALSWPEKICAKALMQQVEWPDHGKSRSLDLGVKPVIPDLDRLEQSGLQYSKPWIVQASECNARGEMRIDILQELHYSAEALEHAKEEWVIETADGRRLGAADLETRNTYQRVPSEGDELQIFSAVTALANKTYVRYSWVFDMQRREPCAVMAVVVVMLDLEARRATEIPDEHRAALEKRLYPDVSELGQ